jgi:hypothetical protein
MSHSEDLTSSDKSGRAYRTVFEIVQEEEA